jgi:hypothetical protein
MDWRAAHRGWVDGELALAGQPALPAMPAARALDLLEALHVRSVVLDVTHTDPENTAVGPWGSRLLRIAGGLLGYEQPDTALVDVAEPPRRGVMSKEDARRARDTWGLDDGPDA